MSDYFIGELRIFSSATTNQIPAGWLPCEGQLLPINQYQVLYSLLGTQFGGNATTTFALPDLRGRAILAAQPSATGQPYVKVGAAGGSETVTLAATEIPIHNHTITASTATDSPAPVPNANYIGVARAGAQAPAANLYTAVTTNSGDLLPLNAASMGPVGGGVGHENRQPLLALRIYICATMGMYPQRQ